MTLENQDEMLRRADLARKRAEALHDSGREEWAVAVWREAIELYDRVSESSRGLVEDRGSAAEPSREQLALAALWAEARGRQGGVHRRLGEQAAALDCYAEGKAVEERFGLASTYNRLNFVLGSLQLPAGDPRRKRVSELQQESETVAGAIEERLRSDPELGGECWPWADLGLCRALLGDAEGAARAYREFADKAPRDLAEDIASVLAGLAAKLGETEPEAERRITAVLRRLDRMS